MKKVILTFDDGPSNNFGELLNYLIKNNHKAIFFCCGQHIENSKNKKLLIRAIKNGFILGNHSYSHPNFNFISYERGKDEIIKTDNLINQLYKRAKIKRKIRLFRFPSFREGGINFFKYQYLLKLLNYSNPYHKPLNFRVKSRIKFFFYHFLQNIYRGKRDVYCTVDPSDWINNSSFEKIKVVLGEVKNGDIIDLHDLPGHITLLKQICVCLSKKGFKLCI
jgi:peptidoglycan/xylan/chitin deacetylase (PgdA/CDA1 family)